MRIGDSQAPRPTSQARQAPQASPRAQALSMPGYPDAQSLSDHYAEGDTLAFDQP